MAHDDKLLVFGTLETPKMPNFLRAKLHGVDVSINVGTLTPEQAEAFAAIWTEAFTHHCAKLREVLGNG